MSDTRDISAQLRADALAGMQEISERELSGPLRDALGTIVSAVPLKSSIIANGIVADTAREIESLRVGMYFKGLGGYEDLSQIKDGAPRFLDSSQVITAARQGHAVKGLGDMHIRDILDGVNVMVRQKNSWVASGSGSLPSE